MLACDAFDMCQGSVFTLPSWTSPLKLLTFSGFDLHAALLHLPPYLSTLITIGWQAVNDLRLYTIWLSALLQVRPEGSRCELARRVEQILSWVG